MKLAVLVATLLFGAGIAHADRDPFAGPAPVDPYADTRPVDPFAAPRAKAKRTFLRRALVQQFDRNGDGTLEGRERKQAARALRRLAHQLQKQGRALQQRSRRDRLIQRFDLDGDGNVGPGVVPARVKNRLRKIDRNGVIWIGIDEVP